MGHFEYSGSRFWLPLKQQRATYYRKARQERKCDEVFEEADGMLLPLRHAAEACYATSPSAKNMGRLNFVKKAVVIHRGEWVDLVSKNTARHPGSTRATAECDISDSYSCNKGKQV